MHYVIVLVVELGMCFNFNLCKLNFLFKLFISKSGD